MPNAARIGDMHTCPKVEPGPTPHVGGPDISGSPDVITGYMPQARKGDSLICVPAIDKIKKGSPTVLVNNRDAARIGDPTVHGGVIVVGCPTVIIGESGQGATLRAASASGTPFCEECEKAKKELEEQLLLEPSPPTKPPADSVVAKDGGKTPLGGAVAKLAAIVTPARRKKLAKLAQVIKPAAEQLLAAGKDGASVADWAVTARKCLAAACDTELESYGDVVAHVYARNEKKFGSKLGPSAKWLMSKKGKRARDIIEAAASGDLEGELTDLGADLAEQLAGKYTSDPTVKTIVRLAATGDTDKIQNVVIDRIVGDVVPNEQAAKLVKAAVQGELPETLAEMSGAVVDQYVAELVPNEQAAKLVAAAVKGELPSTLSDMSGGVVDGVAAKLVPNEQVRSWLEPLIKELKKQVGQAVEREVSTVLSGGGA